MISRRVALVGLRVVLGGFLALLGAANFAASARAADVGVRLDVTSAGAIIPTNFIGLSFEASLLLPGKTGVRYFRPDNAPLLQLFRTLGARSLRIGGNTSDRDAKQLPRPEDWDSLFAFAQAADVKVIYCLQLCRGDQQVAVDTVKYLMSRYAPWVDSFSIGQEPSAYPIGAVDERPASERMGPAVEKYTYAAYAREWKQFAAAIIAAVPEVRLSGPAVHNDGRWATQFLADFGRGYNVSSVFMHLYPGGAGTQVSSPEFGRKQMLSDEFTRVYQKLHDSFVPQVRTNDLAYRLEEVNNFYYGGAAQVSSTFAAALWGLDFMHWWARHGAEGLNFHTGDQVAAGSTMTPCRYTAFYSIPQGHVVRPLGYGIKAFELASHGRLLPVNVTKLPGVNVSVYPVLGVDQRVYVTIINKESDSAARPVTVSLAWTGRRFERAEQMELSSPGHDLAAESGLRLGGAAIGADATWNGRWQVVDARGQLTKDTLDLAMPPATARIIRLSAGGAELSRY